ncbi:MAG: putative tricarboxylic transport rane protein [Alphaproteobacteria bacterium]|nr:putative tricarboxylic transport rane protein [Alphaproteobacteria bacterium]
MALHRGPRDHSLSVQSLLAHVFKFRRDFCAGGLMMLFGLVAASKGPEYRVGTLMHMGPGFMPTVLGVLLVVLGMLIAGAAAAGDHEEGEENILPAHPQWFAWLCILAGPLLFIVFGSLGGMAPATFACVFVSALGDRAATWKSALILAALITVFGVLLFHYVLQIPMTVLQWNPSIFSGRL